MTWKGTGPVSLQGSGRAPKVFAVKYSTHRSSFIKPCRRMPWRNVSCSSLLIGNTTQVLRYVHNHVATSDHSNAPPRRRQCTQTRPRLSLYPACRRVRLRGARARAHSHHTWHARPLPCAAVQPAHRLGTSLWICVRAFLCVHHCSAPPGHTHRSLTTHMMAIHWWTWTWSCACSMPHLRYAKAQQAILHAARHREQH